MKKFTFIIKDKRNNDIYVVYGYGNNVGEAREEALIKLSLQQHGTFDGDTKAQGLFCMKNYKTERAFLGHHKNVLND